MLPNKLTNELYKPSDYYISFALLRITVAGVIILDKLFSWEALDMLYSDASFIAHERGGSGIMDFLGYDYSSFSDHYIYINAAFLFFALLFLFGVGRNIVPVVLFLLNEIIQGANYSILNGGDNFLKFILLYLCFGNCYKYFSLNDTGINNKRLRLVDNLFTNISILATKTHLCIIYYITGIAKLNSDTWLKEGVGTYYSFLAERFQGTSFVKYLVQSSFFSYSTNYFTLFWEGAAPFLLWFRSTKYIMIFFGMLLHLGIYLFMMLYGFELLFISCLFLFLEDSFWLKHFNNVKRKSNIFFSRLQKNKKESSTFT